jgi:hypothetical protein
MAVANTLAYYLTATITAVKSFIVQAPGPNVSKLLKTSVLSKNKCFGNTLQVPEMPGFEPLKWGSDVDGSTREY